MPCAWSAAGRGQCRTHARVLETSIDGVGADEGEAGDGNRDAVDSWRIFVPGRPSNDRGGYRSVQQLSGSRTHLGLPQVFDVRYQFLRPCVRWRIPRSAVDHLFHIRRRPNPSTFAVSAQHPAEVRSLRARTRSPERGVSRIARRSRSGAADGVCNVRMSLPFRETNSRWTRRGVKTDHSSNILPQWPRLML